MGYSRNEPAERAHLQPFPMKMLGSGVFITLILVSSLGWIVWLMYRDFSKIATDEMQLQRLTTTILHYDEVLTTSARMAAATNEPHWEKRYRIYETKLDSAIQRAIRLAHDAYS